MTDSFVGRTLGKYQVLEKLGQGGMGKVYKGSQISLNRPVAIKVLSAQMAMDPEFVERFQQEARVIAALKHENIVHVYDIDEIRNADNEAIYFIVMEYVDGYNLRERPEGQGPMTTGEVRAVGIALAGALGYAHREGIVHRDIKSANVMVTSDGLIKLMDFGIAKSAGGVKTATGSVLGTPEYMAPEQARSGEVTPRSDLYSLGVLLYELSTGRLPFEGGDPFAIALKHITETVPPPRGIEPSIPPQLDAIIRKCLEKDPVQRFANAQELAEQLMLLEAPEIGGTSGRLRAATGVRLTDSPTTALPLHEDLITTDSFRPPPPTAGPPPPPIPASASVLPATGGTDLDATIPLTTPPRSEPVAPSQPYSQGPATGQPSTVTLPPTPGRPAWLLPLVGVGALLLLLCLAGVGWLLTRSTPEKAETPAIAATPQQTATEPPATPPDPLENARLLLDEGRLAEARAALEPVLAEDIIHPEARQLMQKIDEQERQTEALGILEEAREGNQDAMASLPEQSPGTSGRDAKGEGRAGVPVRVGTESLPPSTVAPAPQARQPAPPPTVAQPSPSQLWAKARRHKKNDEFHSLRDTLDRLLATGKANSEAQQWNDRVDRWINSQEDDLREELEDQIDDLIDAIEGKDYDDLQELWGDRLDPKTERAIQKTWDRWKKLEVEINISQDRYFDQQVDFAAQIRIRGRDSRRDSWKPVRQSTWRGRFVDDDRGKRFTSPWPG